jgi:tRNA threonylcarbamoyladenosine biosynthesis protein TsaB
VIALAVDTTSARIGVAATDGHRTAVRTGLVARDAELVLTPWTLELLEEMGAVWSDVGGVGVAVGPGTFTGTRVGVAHALGIAIARRLPVVGADGLRARAVAADADGDVLVLLDARRSRAYAAALCRGSLRVGPEDVAPEAAVTWMTAPFVATGEGAIRWADTVVAGGGRVVEDPSDPAVDHLARHCFTDLVAGKGTPPGSLNLRYLRAPGVEAP